MKALFLSNDPSIFIPGSPARERMKAYAREIGILYVISRAHQKDVAAYKHGMSEEGLTLVAVGGGKLLSLLALLYAAKRLIQKEGIEIVSAQDPFEYGWIAYQACRGTSTKLHLQVHTDFCSEWFTRVSVMRSARVPMPLMNKVRVRIADRILPYAHGIRAVSVRVKEGVESRYGNRIAPVAVIPIATFVTLPAPVALPARAFTFTLITVARIEPEKRIEDALDVLVRLLPLYPMLGLVIVGDGRYRKKLEAYAHARGLRDHVLFLGWRSDALGLMQSAQAYIQTSAYEGYGLSLLEAALARLPIITTDVGIVGEVFTGYEDVLVAPVADPAALAVHVTGLLEDAQSRTMLALNAERKAQAHLAMMKDQPRMVASNLTETLTRA